MQQENGLYSIKDNNKKWDALGTHYRENKFGYEEKEGTKG